VWARRDPMDCDLYCYEEPPLSTATASPLEVSAYLDQVWAASPVIDVTALQVIPTRCPCRQGYRYLYASEPRQIVTTPRQSDRGHYTATLTLARQRASCCCCCCSCW
jgi:hypothetical protein